MPLKDSLAGKTEYKEFKLKAINRRGKTSICRVKWPPFVGPQSRTDGIVLIVDEIDTRAQKL